MGWKGGGGFRFYKLGAPVFDPEGRINPDIRFAHLAAHIWFSETHTALRKKSPQRVRLAFITARPIICFTTAFWTTNGQTGGMC